MMAPGSPVSQRANYTRRQRVLAAGILVGAAAVTIFVRRVLRPHADHLGIPARGVLGWLPNFCAAVGSPFLWTMVGARPAGPLRRWGFADNCLWVLAILLGYEVSQAFDPGQTFDWADIAASAAGVIVAFGVYHLLLHRLDPSAAQQPSDP
jgi:hypothetical protein